MTYIVINWELKNVLWKYFLIQANILHVKCQMQVIRGRGEVLVFFQIIVVQFIENPNPVLLILNPPTEFLYVENLYI